MIHTLWNSGHGFTRMAEHMVSLLLLGTAIQAEVPKWAQPPREESAEIRALIDEAAIALGGPARAHLSVLQTDRFDAIRPYPRFRKLVQDACRWSTIRMVSAKEPGERIDFTLRVRDKDGKAVHGALIYLYHTDARGAYAKDGVHVSGNSGDMKFARLFAYARTDPLGETHFETIRPAGYPSGELPQHFHFNVNGPRPASVGEIWFSDDPRLTPLWKARAREHGALIVTPTRTGEVWKAGAEITI